MGHDLWKRAGVIVLFASAFSAASSGPSFGEDVGVTAATNPVATGEPPGQGLRELKIGLNVVRNERIRTTVDGSTQVIFVDRTSLTIGPNSDITIDEYVYNPGSNSGNLAVRVSNGVLRFIGGQISHSDQIKITTPTATLGIRGGMAIVESVNKKTIIVHLFGTTIVTTPFNSVTLSKPGSYVETSGGHVSTPIPVPPGLLASFNYRLGSKQGQTGGTPPGLATSDATKQIVSTFGQPLPNNPYQGLSPEQLQLILSLRPQSGSIGEPVGPTENSGGTGNECGSYDDDCKKDRHHHRHHRGDRYDHDHDHDHDRDRWARFDHDRDRHDRDSRDWDRDRWDHRDRWDRFTHSGPNDWRFADRGGWVRSSFNRFLISGHNGPCFGPCGFHPGHLGMGHHH